MDVDKVGDSDGLEKIPVAENTYEFIEPFTLTSETQHETLVPRLPRERRSIIFPTHKNNRVLLYVGGTIVFAFALIGIIVSSFAFQKISSLEDGLINNCHGSTPNLPATSCQQILGCNPSASQGHYWIGTEDKVALRHCNMNRTCGGVTGGWMRLVSLDMNEFGSSCPNGLTVREYLGKTFCGKTGGVNSATCGRVLFELMANMTKCVARLSAISMEAQTHLEEAMIQSMKFIWTVLV